MTIKAQRFHHGRETALRVMIFVECPRDIHTKSYFVLLVNPQMLFQGRQWDSETKGLSEALPPRTDLGCDTASICLTVKSVCVCVCVCVCMWSRSSHVQLFATSAGSPVHGILQARILECVTFFFLLNSNWWFQETYIPNLDL